MFDITTILSQIESGDPSAPEQLLPLVYVELRKLTAGHLANEKVGQTLQATALVHEAYVRLVTVPAAKSVDSTPEQLWNGRRHFFAAAALAMRRILVDNAWRKRSIKHGGAFQRLDFDPTDLLAAEKSAELLALDEALDRLCVQDSQAAEFVKLRYFAGLTIAQSAEMLGVSPRNANLLWSFARAWLRRKIEGSL